MMSWSIVPLVTAVILLAWSIRRDDFVFSYATMMVGATAYFVIPGLCHIDRYELFDSSTRMVASVYVSICMVLAARGWLRPFDGLVRYIPRYDVFPAWQLLVAYCAGAILFSSYFAWKLRGVDPALLEVGAWSGPHVIYYFFTQPGYYVISVAAVAYAMTRKLAFAVIAVIAVLLFLLPPVVNGKRDEIVEAGVVFLVCWVLVLRRKFPKTLVVAVAVFLALVFTAIGVYRSVARQEGVVRGVVSALTAVSDEQLPPSYYYKEVGNFVGTTKLVMDGGAPPNLGLAYWNMLVFRFVPGQILGHDFKQALQFDGFGVSKEDLVGVGARPTTGTTHTGFSDTLQAFWFFGPLVFYVIGRALRTVFLLASSQQSVYLFVYAHLLVKSGVGVTHSTISFIAAAINLFVFVGIWVHLIQRRSSVC